LPRRALAALPPKAKEPFMLAFFVQFFRNELAATSIEYALLAAGVAVAIVSAVNTVGTTVQAKFAAVQNAFP
jgi:pilus assembly protein Flp/PilA